jgi:Mrp family chromosome partitioning ATPase
LASKEIAQLISELRPEYDFVLIDAPPILVVNDSAALASLADGTILSVAAGGTRLEALNRSADYIAASGGKLVGLVLNMFDPRRAYGSYYGSYRYGHYGPGYGHYVPEQERS